MPIVPLDWAILVVSTECSQTEKQRTSRGPPYPFWNGTGRPEETGDPSCPAALFRHPPARSRNEHSNSAGPPWSHEGGNDPTLPSGHEKNRVSVFAAHWTSNGSRLCLGSDPDRQLHRLWKKWWWEGDSNARTDYRNRFTVCVLWPLAYPTIQLTAKGRGKAVPRPLPREFLRLSPLFPPVPISGSPAQVASLRKQH
jgi:hypothetical protein